MVLLGGNKNMFSVGKKSLGWLAPLRICNRAGSDGDSKLTPLTSKNGGFGEVMLRVRATSGGPLPPGCKEDKSKPLIRRKTNGTYSTWVDQGMKIGLIHGDSGSGVGSGFDCWSATVT